MDFSLTEEERQTRDWVRNFVQREIVPMEPEVLRRERAHQPGITADELAELKNKARRFGFWGIQTPAEYGGMDLSAVLASLIEAELGRSFVPFRFGGSADNILFHA
ncbi:MAG TPA: acyl-CoA dehydrogenase family protein, partial [Jatrophihabitans sp.]